MATPKPPPMPLSNAAHNAAMNALHPAPTAAEIAAFQASHPAPTAAQIAAMQAAHPLPAHTDTHPVVALVGHAPPLHHG